MDVHKPDVRYYVVLETANGGTIVTEQLEDSVAWEENVEDLEDRNSLARVVRTGSCNRTGIRVQDVRNCQRCMYGSIRSKSQAYATNMYTCVMGGVQAVLESTENTAKDCYAKKDVDVEDVQLEERLVEQVAAVGEKAKMSPCSQCSEPLATGYKGARGSWICKVCLEVEQAARQKQVEEDSRHNWQD